MTTIGIVWEIAQALGALAGFAALALLLPERWRHWRVRRLVARATERDPGFASRRH